MYLIISFYVYNNPMCTTTHTVIKITLSYAYHLFHLWKQNQHCSILIHFTQLIIL